MFRHCRSLQLCFVLSCGTLAVVLIDSESSADGHQQVLLLHNYNVLQGKIDRKNKDYRVMMTQGELRVSSDKVLALCRDLDAAYHFRQTHILSGSVEEHLALAQWCLKYGLWEKTAQELRKARTCDARHPRLPLLQRRLELAVNKAVDQNPLATKSVPNEKTSPDPTLVLPPGSLHQFTAVIQPLLLHGCSTAACHGLQSSNAFHLQRAPGRQAISPHLTQRNLRSSLRQIEPEIPEKSSLLIMARQPHGNNRGAVFGLDSSESYELLHRWVQQVAAVLKANEDDLTTRPVPHEVIVSPKSTSLQVRKVLSVSEAKKRLVASRRTSLRPSKAPAILDSPVQPKPSKKKRSKIQKEKSMGHDPFDPAIFNRRYIPNSPQPHPPIPPLL